MKTNEIMKEFYPEYKRAAAGKKYFTWKDMISDEQFKAKYFGYDRIKVGAMKRFATNLKENFGEDKTKVIIGMIGKKDYAELTGYLCINESSIKKMTAEALKKDIEQEA
jgi:hypothetical protein